MAGARRISKRLFTRMQRDLAWRLIDEPVVPPCRKVKVMVCDLREILEPYGVQIANKYGVGYCLTDESRAKLKELLA